MATHVANCFTSARGKNVFFYSTPTEASVAQIFTNADHTTQSAWITYVSLQCDGTGVNPKIYDGSDGNAFFGLMCQSAGKTSASLDCESQPIPFFTGTTDVTQAVCVSAPALGTYSGFIKYYWGPRAK